MNPIGSSGAVANVVDDVVHTIVSDMVLPGKKRSSLAVSDVASLAMMADKHGEGAVVTPVKGDLSVAPGSAASPASAGMADDKAEKRQKRLAKNREAAQMFRQRQKAYIQDLEKRGNDLQTENAALRSKLELLTAENKVIRDQLAYLRSVIGNAVQVNMDKPVPGSKHDPDGQSGQ